jgi:phenylalanyl-tRNA synthetase beta chain
MPTVKLNRNAIEHKIGKKLTEEELKEAITYLGTALEEINDSEIDVEIFPNRPDMLSEQGLGRALSSYLGVHKGLAKYNIKSSGMKVIVEKSVAKVRPFTACAIVKGLKFDDEKIKEIVQIQEKLHITYGRNRKKCAIGVYPMEKIKFPIRFVAEEPSKIKFQPLEMPHAITGLQILSQHPTGREYAYLLEGKDKFPIFLDANNQVLSMPPIINSHNVGKISYDTVDVFIECSGFNQKVLDICLNMIVTSLADMGGHIYSVELINEHEDWTKDSPDLSPTRKKIDLHYVNKILGLELTEKQMADCLEKMGHDYDSKKKEVLTPAYRADVLHQIDFVEDIAIAYGFKKFQPKIPNCATVGSRAPAEMLKVKVAEILSGLGLFETNTYCLVGEHQIYDKGSVKLANSVAEGYDYLRNLMLPSLLDALRNNRNRSYPQGFFEVGNTFQRDIFQKTDTGINEGRNLAFIYADKDTEYTYAKQVLEYLFSNLNLAIEIKSPKLKNKLFMEGRFANILLGGEVIGQVGQINPEALTAFGLEVPAVGFELDFLTVVDAVRNK